MRQTYQCPDGRVVLLAWDKRELTVTAATFDAGQIATWRFAKIEAATLGEHKPGATGGPGGLALVEFAIASAWTRQGLTERVMRLVRDDMAL